MPDGKTAAGSEVSRNNRLNMAEGGKAMGRAEKGLPKSPFHELGRIVTITKRKERRAIPGTKSTCSKG